MFPHFDKTGLAMANTMLTRCTFGTMCRKNQFGSPLTSLDPRHLYNKKQFPPFL